MGKRVIMEVTIPLLIKPNKKGELELPDGYVQRTTSNGVNYLIEGKEETPTPIMPNYA